MSTKNQLAQRRASRMARVAAGLIAVALLAALVATGLGVTGRHAASAAGAPAPDSPAGGGVYFSGGRVLSPLQVELRDGRAWVPLRLLAEALGLAVAWDAPTGRITLSSPGEAVTPGGPSGQAGGAAGYPPGVSPPATSEPAARVVVSRQYAFTDGAGYRRVFGELVNTGGAAAVRAKVTGIALDAAGKVLDITTAGALLERVTPGGTAPFELVFLAKPSDIASIRLIPEASTDPGNGEGFAVPVAIETQARFAIPASVSSASPGSAGSSGSRSPGLPGLKVAGSVKNTSGRALTEVKVVVTGYGAGGAPVALDFVFLPVDRLEAGATARYGVVISNNAALMGLFTVQAEGR